MYREYKKILLDLGSSPELSVSSACQGWKESLATYRFMNNKKVEVDKIIQPHATATLERIKREKVVLIIQDTTEIDFTGRKTLSDVGYLSTEYSKGFYLHPSIAVTPSKSCLGVIDAQFYNRESIATDKYDRRTKPIEQRESYCWLKGYDAANKIAQAAL